MPFGLTNAPATFQSMMNDILRDYIDKCAMVYLDDIIIFSKTKGEHIENGLVVVRELQKEGLVLNEGKCEWGWSSILYIGHVTRILKWLQQYYSGHLADDFGGARFLEYRGILPTVYPRVCKGGKPTVQIGPRKGSPIQWTKECESAMRRLTIRQHSPLLTF